MKMKKMLIAFLMQFFALGMTISQPANADTLSDLRAACPTCHNVIVKPSGWSLDGRTTGRIASERSVQDWLYTIERMMAAGSPGVSSNTDAAQFLYDKQYATSTSSPLTSISVTPVNPSIKIGESLQFTATGTQSNGASRVLVGGGGTWVSRAPMSTARNGPAVGVLNSTLYAVGGWGGSLILETVEAYNPVTNTWTPKASMATPRANHAVGVINGQVYAVGGANRQPLATVEAYDPATNTWMPKASMSTPREAVGVGVVNDILYAVGGWNYGSGLGSSLVTVEAYDPATNTWSPRASMSTPRYYSGVAVVGDMLYVVGGYDESGGALASVEAYDPATNTWMPKASMPTPRSAPAIGVVNGTLYVSGGYNGSYLTTMEAYNPATDTWTPKTSMATARFGQNVGEVVGKLYAVGGADFPASSAVEAYTPPDDITWNSSATNVATVSQSGLAVGVSNGQTTITAASEGISGSTSLQASNSADLIISTVSGSVATVERGKSFTFNSTTTNQGTAATAISTSTGLFLSTDATITIADARVGTVSVGILATAASQSASTIVTVPKTLARGTYYLGAIADYTGVQAESNESNNSFTGTTILVK